MTEDQKSTLLCAFLDLIGSYQQNEFGDYAGFSHDWESHLYTIRDLFEHFPELSNDPENQLLFEKFEDRLRHGVE